MSLSDCLCENTNLVRCFNGDCVQDYTECQPGPFQLKAFPLEYTVDTLLAQTIGIIDYTGSWLGSISIDSNSFLGASSVNIWVTPVADSVARNATFSSWSTKDQQNLAQVMSPMISVVADFPVTSVNLTFYLYVNESKLEQSTACLAYINTSIGAWVCEDYTLDIEYDSTQQRWKATGTTTHFTDYAILLGGSPQDNLGTSTSSPSTMNVSGGVPKAAIYSVVVIALVLIIVGAIAVVIWKKREAAQEERDLNPTMNNFELKSSDRDSNQSLTTSRNFLITEGTKQ